MIVKNCKQAIILTIMGEPANDDSKGKDITPEKELGMSRFIYATGNSVKDAFIWGSLATIALIGGIVIGKGKAAAGEENILSKLAENIEKGHLASKKWLGDKFGKMLGKSKSKLPEVTATELGASVVAGTLIGHLVQIPSFHQGWKQAQKSVDKYEALNGEKTELVEANARLIEENQRLRASLDKKPDASFTDRMVKPGAEAASFSERVQQPAEADAALAGARGA